MSSKRCVAPVLACLALAVPATASAHARTPTVALDYRLVLDDTTRSLPNVDVAILDGDRDIRVHVRHGRLTVLGDLGEPMLRIDSRGAYADASSPSAAAARLVTHGSGWRRVGGATLVWHDHRLAPPPYEAKAGPSGRFSIPALLDGHRVVLGGTFMRVTRPSPWPWAAAAASCALILAALARVRSRWRSPLAIGLGGLAVLAALTALVTFNAADAPNGHVAWTQIALGVILAGVGGAMLIRLRGEARTLFAGILGAAAAVSSLGSLGVFRHGVVVSLLSPAAARAVAATAIAAGLAAAATLLQHERVRR